MHFAVYDGNRDTLGNQWKGMEEKDEDLDEDYYQHRMRHDMVAAAVSVTEHTPLMEFAEFLIAYGVPLPADSALVVNN